MKKVIYTSLVGNYDTLTEPKYILKGWDYICFSNDVIESPNSIWKIKPIPYENKDNLRLSRYVKLNPHKVLDTYEISLWMDANLIMIDNSVELRLNELIEANALISIPCHPYRDCIYQEAEVCVKEGKDFSATFNKQIKYLKKQNFPENFGLYENNIIFRRHTDEKMKKMNEAWWDLYIQFSKRDQLSLAFLLWKHNINCEMFFKDGTSARSFSGVNYVEHKESKKLRIQRLFKIRLNKIIDRLN